MNSKHRVRMNNKLIEATYKIELREKKMMLGMLNQVIRRGDQEEYSINIRETAEITGLNEKSLYRDIKEVMRSLDELKFKIEDDENEILRAIFPFQDYDYEQGLLNFSLSRRFKAYVLQHKEDYTKYFLRNVRRMRSVYSIRLYELLKQYEPGGAQARRFEISKLQEKLQCSYGRFNDFKKYVVEKAITEINSHSDITTSYFLEKKGRSNHWITFTITPKTTQENLAENEEKTPQAPPVEAYVNTIEKEFLSRGIKWPIFKNLLIKNNITWESVWFFWNEVLKNYLKNQSPKNHAKIIIKTFDLLDEKSSETKEMFLNQMTGYHFRDMSHIPKQ